MAIYGLYILTAFTLFVSLKGTETTRFLETQGRVTPTSDDEDIGVEDPVTSTLWHNEEHFKLDTLDSEFMDSQGRMLEMDGRSLACTTCSGHGQCLGDGTCQCYTGYFGTSCQLEATLISRVQQVIKIAPNTAGYFYYHISSPKDPMDFLFIKEGKEALIDVYFILQKISDYSRQVSFSSDSTTITYTRRRLTYYSGFDIVFKVSNKDSTNSSLVHARVGPTVRDFMIKLAIGLSVGAVGLSILCYIIRHMWRKRKERMRRATMAVVPQDFNASQPESFQKELY